MPRTATLILGILLIIPAIARAADEAQSKRIAALIEQLGDVDFVKREAAQRDLVEIGLPAMQQLSEGEKHAIPEIAQRSTESIRQIIAGVEKYREKLRAGAELGRNRDDYPSLRRNYLALLTLPEPHLRDARPAMRAFERHRDWAAYSDALEVAADCMWRVTHLPADAFVKPSEVPIEGNRMSVLVQTNLDGEWSQGKGSEQNWTDWIDRKQQDLRLERIEILKKLGTLCMQKLNDPTRAAKAYEAAGWDIPLHALPLEKLCELMWPKVTLKADDVLALSRAGAAAIRISVLDGLSESQEAAGDLRSAADSRLRAMLAALLADNGDWNAHGPMQEAEAFWRIARRLPLDERFPPTLWLSMLRREKPELSFVNPEAGPHGLPRSFAGPRIVIEPGALAHSITISADMDSPGGGGGVRCFSFIDGKARDLGWVQWHKDGRKAREWREGKFDLPEGVGILRIEITPYSGADFHVREIKAKAEFTPQQ